VCRKTIDARTIIKKMKWKGMSSASCATRWNGNGLNPPHLEVEQTIYTVSERAQPAKKSDYFCDAFYYDLGT